MLLAKYDSNQLKNDILSIKDATMISNIRCANCDLQNNTRDIELNLYGFVVMSELRVGKLKIEEL